MPEHIVVDADILVITAIFLVFPDAGADGDCGFSPAWRAEAAVVEGVPCDFHIADAALFEPIRAVALKIYRRARHVEIVQVDDNLGTRAEQKTTGAV